MKGGYFAGATNGAVQTQVLITPEMYGAIGNGIADDTEAIQDALDASNLLGLPLFFGQGKQYLISSTLIYYHNQEIYGNNSTLVRGDVRSTTIMAIAASGALSIQVTDASIFSIGDKFMLLSAASPYGGTGYGENSLNSANPQIVTSIVGNTINFANAISLPIDGSIVQYPIGAPAVIIHDMLTYDSGTVENVVIRDLIFDGNSSSNNFSFDWRINNTLPFRVPNGIIFNCRFRNTPTENITLGHNTTVLYCVGSSLNGSFIHVSMINSGNLDENIFISENRVLTSNIIDPAITGHSEAAITYSANVQRLHIIDNKFYNVQAYIIGGANASSNSTELIFDDNECYDCTNIFTGNVSGSSNLIEDTWIRGNKFENCGGISLGSAGGIKTGGGVKGVKIEGNEFTNTTMYIYATDVVIDDNTIEIETTFNFPTPFNANRDACIFAIGFGIKVTNNTLTGKGTYDANCRYGIMVLSDGAVNSAPATPTFWSYTQNVDISDNVVTGFVNGIATEISTYAVSQTYSRVNWNIRDNQVVICAKGAATYGYGIYAAAGVVCEHNTVYSASGDYTYLIVVAGVNPASGAIETTCPGAIARFNTCFAPGAVGMFVGGAPNTYNALCEYNISSGNSDANAFFDNSGGFSVLASNRRTNTLGIALPAPSIILARQNPGFY
jgi:hypothetical protein